MSDDHDPVTSPAHYTDVVPGVECIDVAQHFNYLRGNALKYIWRAGAKDDELVDLRKAAQCLEFEIDRVVRERERARQDLRAGMLADLGLDLDNVEGPLTATTPRRPMPGARILPFLPFRPRQ